MKNLFVIVGILIISALFEAIADYFHHMYWIYKCNNLNFFWYSLLSNIFGIFFISSICAVIAYVCVISKKAIDSL